MRTAATNTARLTRGVLALLGIGLILFGIPAGLLALGGNPLPGSMPSLASIAQSLTRPDDGTLFLRLLTLAGWVGWVSYAVPLLLELVHAFAGVSVPRLPALRLQHRQSAALVAAAGALLTFSAHTATAAETTPGGRPTATATAPATSLAASTARAAGEGHVTVKAGDTLRKIAQREFGDETRWPDIVKATSAHVQPDGQHLTNPDHIEPGWVLNVPTHQDAHTRSSTPKTHTGTSTTPHRSAPTTTATPTHSPRPTATPSRAATPQPSTPTASTSTPPHTPAASAPTRSTTPATPATPTPTAATPSRTAVPHVPANAPAAESDATTNSTADPRALADTIAEYAAPTLFTVAGLSSLGAAGLLTALARRRRQQARHRRPGQRIALPTGDAAAAETELRAGADPLTADHLDRALRTLAAHAHHAGLPVPALNAARITTDSLELYLADTDATLPAPFTALPTDAGAWTFNRNNLDALLTTDEAAHTNAPYPALVTLGADDTNATLLINLEQITTLGLTGDTTTTHEVLTALAVELLTSTWCDDARITLVGVLPELVDAIGSDRATFVDDIDAALPALDYMARVHRDALTREGLDGVRQARERAVLDETWTPHVVLVSDDLTDVDRERLTRLVADVPRISVAAVTTGAAPLGRWALDVTAGDDAGAPPVGVLAPAGLRITPQRLSAHDLRRVLDVFAVTEEASVPGPAWVAGISDDTAFDMDALPDPAPQVEDQEPAAVAEAQEPTTHVDPVGDDVVDGVDDEAPGRTGSHVAFLNVATDITDDAPSDDAADTTADPDLVDDATDDHRPVADATAAEVDGGHLELAADAETDEDRRDVVEELGAGEQVEDIDAAADNVDPVSDNQEQVAVEDDDAVLDRLESEFPTPSTRVAVDDLPDERMLVRLLGPVEVRSASSRTSKPPTRTREIVAYLALQPDRGEIAFSEAMFRGERPQGEKVRTKRNTYMARARSWVGEVAGGRPVIGYVDDIGYALDPATPVDYWRFREHIGDDIPTASNRDLAAALKLVTGRPLSGIDPTKFVWAESIATDLINAVADVAYELASRALHAGDTPTAIWALEKGLLADTSQEALWRLRIAAAAQAHQSTRDVIARMHASLDDDIDLDPQTLQIIQSAHERVPA